MAPKSRKERAMKVKLKETTLTDGSRVHDINLFPNGGAPMDQRVIISCYSEEAATKFLSAFEDLLAEYTVESVDLLP